MTIGMVLRLPDGVLLMADGRIRKPLAGNALVRDDANKVQQIAPKIFGIPFGVEQASDLVLEQLRSTTTPDTPKEYADLLQLAVHQIWTGIENRFSDDVDRTDPRLKVAILVGGILNGLPFITGALRGVGGIGDSSSSDAMYDLFSLGGEEHGAHAAFIRARDNVCDTHKWKADIGPKNPQISALLRKAGRVIRDVGRRNEDIGGTIRYAVIREPFPTLTDILSIRAKT